jgi:acyl carrier protein
MVDAEAVRRRISEILTSNSAMSLQLDIEALNDQTSLSHDLALDSIQRLEFCVALEDAFGLKFNEELFGSPLDRLGALVAHIGKTAAEIRPAR